MSNDEVEVDIDELLDMDSDDERRRHLQVHIHICISSSPCLYLPSSNLYLSSTYYLCVHILLPYIRRFVAIKLKAS